MTSSQRIPAVSVLIPTYNYARYLPEAIESVLNQSFDDFELIISDDASNDASAEVIQRYARQDARIRFTLQSPNLGMVSNWNWCLKQARGRYIKFLFGDDFLTSRNAVAQLVDMMEQGPDVRLAASARRIVNEHSQPTDLWNHIGTQGVYDGTDIIIRTLHAYGNLIGEPSAVMFRRADADRGFDPSFKQIVDWEFWLYLLQRGQFAFADEPLCAFRQHSLQQTEANRLAQGPMGENAQLLRLYCHYLMRRPADRQRVFDRLYYLSKKQNPDEAELQWMEVLRNSLGHAYYFYWVRRKLTQPLINTRRLWRKHIVRTFFKGNPSHTPHHDR